MTALVFIAGTCAVVALIWLVTMRPIIASAAWLLMVLCGACHEVQHGNTTNAMFGLAGGVVYAFAPLYIYRSIQKTRNCEES